MMQPLDRLLDRALHEDLTDSRCPTWWAPSRGEILGKATHVHHPSRRCHSMAALETTREYLAAAIRAPEWFRSAGVGLTVPVLAPCSRISPPCPAALASAAANLGRPCSSSTAAPHSAAESLPHRLCGSATSAESPWEFPPIVPRFNYS
jgi:hypothetical protein